MINIIDKLNVDTKNKIERDIDGCKMRLFFSLERNEIAERLVLDNLMLVFDRKMQRLGSVQN